MRIIGIILFIKQITEVLGSGQLPSKQQQQETNNQNPYSPHSKQSNLQKPSTCNSIPFNHITPCLSTCSYCLGSSKRQSCSLCAPQFQLSSTNSQCTTPVGSQYFKSSFFMNEQTLNGDIRNFYNKNGLLTPQDLTTLCIASLYKFQIAGLFYANQEIFHNVKFPRQIDSISLNFRVFSIKEHAKLTIQINNKLAFSQLLQGTQFSIQYQSSVQKPYAIIQSNPTQYLDSVFFPVHTGFLPTKGFSASIKFTVSCPSALPCWGFSQMVITGKKCQTCVAKQVKQMEKILGIIMGVSAIMLSVCISSIFVHNIIVEDRNKKKIHERIKKTLKQNDEQQKQLQKYRGSSRKISIQYEQSESLNTRYIIETPTQKKFYFF